MESIGELKIKDKNFLFTFSELNFSVKGNLSGWNKRIQEQKLFNVVVYNLKCKNKIIRFFELLYKKIFKKRTIFYNCNIKNITITDKPNEINTKVSLYYEYREQ